VFFSEAPVTPATLFDYAALAEDDRAFVLAKTADIRLRMKRAAEDIIAIGRDLVAVKGRLGHGHFEGWLSAEFEWSDQTARRFIHVAERFGDKQQIVAFAPSALYALSAPSVPESARQEAEVRASRGEEITHTMAKEIINAHRPPAGGYQCEPDEIFSGPGGEVEEPAPPPPAPASPWSERERTLREKIEAGDAVAVNMTTDRQLVEWAQARGLYVRIDRATEWGNPFHGGSHRTTLLRGSRSAYNRAPSPAPGRLARSADWCRVPSGR
jgi:hypothetical protein